ncbi:MAG: UPF0147 family protein [Nanoarchaeota archaeon]
MNQELQSVIDTLMEFQDDDSVPRNVKTRMVETAQALKSDESLSIRINKALSILDEVSDDTNIQPYTRTQIWGISSMLESIDADQDE